MLTSPISKITSTTQRKRTVVEVSQCNCLSNSIWLDDDHKQMLARAKDMVRSFCSVAETG